MKLAIFLLLNGCLAYIVSSFSEHHMLSNLTLMRVDSKAKSKCKDSSEIGMTVYYNYWKGTKTDASKNGVLAGLSKFKSWSAQTPKEESFKYRDGDIVGYMWIGSMLQNTGFGDNVISLFETEVKNNGFPSSGYFEYVDPERDPQKTFGIAFQTGGKLSSVQRAVKLWSQGKKFDTKTDTKSFDHVPVCYLDYPNRKPVINDERAGPCYFVTMEENMDLEKTTGVIAENLHGYNPGLDFNYLQAGQKICYSVGSK